MKIRSIIAEIVVVDVVFVFVCVFALILFFDVFVLIVIVGPNLNLKFGKNGAGNS